MPAKIVWFALCSYGDMIGFDDMGSVENMNKCSGKGVNGEGRQSLDVAEMALPNKKDFLVGCEQGGERRRDLIDEQPPPKSLFNKMMDGFSLQRRSFASVQMALLQLTDLQREKEEDPDGREMQAAESFRYLSV